MPPLPLSPNLSKAGLLRGLGGWNNSSLSRRNNTTRGLLSTRVPQSLGTTGGGILNPSIGIGTTRLAMPRNAAGSWAPASASASVVPGPFGYIYTAAGPGDDIRKIDLGSMTQFAILALAHGGDFSAVTPDGALGWQFPSGGAFTVAIKTNLEGSMSTAGSITLASVPTESMTLGPDGDFVFRGVTFSFVEKIDLLDGLVKQTFDASALVPPITFFNVNGAIAPASANPTNGYFFAGDAVIATKSVVVTLRLSNLAIQGLPVDILFTAGAGQEATAASGVVTSDDVTLLVASRGGEIAKIATVTLATALPLTATGVAFGSNGNPAIIDANDEFAYFGGLLGKVVKYKVDDKSSVTYTNGALGTVRMVALDPDGLFGYFGGSSGILAKVRLSDLTTVATFAGTQINAGFVPSIQV